MKKQRKGFTLIELLIVVVIVGILALAAIPLITQNTRDARMAEGFQLAGTMRNQARVEYSKTGSEPANLTAAGVTVGERTGQYYLIADAIGANGTGAASIDGTAIDAGSGDPAIWLSFNWEDGFSEKSH